MLPEGDINPTIPDQGEVLNINVGVLGHVDSGKTSLVKTLSTILSTAALDKSKQSRERGTFHVQTESFVFFFGHAF